MATIHDITKAQAEKLIRGIRNFVRFDPIAKTGDPHFVAILEDDRHPFGIRPPVCCVESVIEGWRGREWFFIDYFESLADSGGKTLRIECGLRFPSQERYEQCTLFTELSSLLGSMGLTPNPLSFLRDTEPSVDVRFQQVFHILAGDEQDSAPQLTEERGNS